MLGRVAIPTTWRVRARRRVRLGVGTGLLLGSITVLTACSSNDVTAESAVAPPDQSPAPPTEPTETATALAPATTIPDNIDDALQLPPDTDPVDFNYTRTSVRSSEGVAHQLGMLVADTYERRTRGLMFRDGLPALTGMLFAFPVPTMGNYWAKDTPFDLDVALLDERGVIIELLSLVAFSTELVTPEAEYLYGVEMPAGWFVDRGIDLGAQFAIPDSVIGFAE